MVISEHGHPESQTMFASHAVQAMLACDKKNNKKQVFEIQSASALFSCALLFRPFVFFTFWNRAKEVCDTAVLCTQDFFSM